MKVLACDGIHEDGLALFRDAGWDVVVAPEPIKDPQILAQAFSNAKYPVVLGLPTGHTQGAVTLPLGVRVRLAGERLTLLESPFQESKHAA